MEMNEILLIVIILFVFLTLIEVILSKIKKTRYNQLMYLLMKQNFNEFDELLEKKSTKFFVPVYNSIFLRVNKAMMMNDSNSFDKLMNDAKKINMNDSQKLHLYSKAFSFYLSLGKKNDCEEYYQKIMKCNDCPTKEYIEMVYDTLIKKSYQYIEKAESMLVTAAVEDKENLRYLIDAMYANKRIVFNQK